MTSECGRSDFSNSRFSFTIFTGSAWSSPSARPIFRATLFISGMCASDLSAIAAISFERSMELSGESCKITSELPSLSGGIKSRPIIGKSANAEAVSIAAANRAAYGKRIEGKIKTRSAKNFIALETRGSPAARAETFFSISEHSTGTSVSATKNDAAIETTTASAKGRNILPSIPASPRVGKNTITIIAVA